MKKFVRVLLALSLVAFMAGPAMAGQAIDFQSVNIDFSNGNWSLGWEFTTNGPVTVAALGFYDDLKNGLTQIHDVGIFDANQVLVAFAQVSNADPLLGWFRYHNITPVVLQAGQSYFIQAVTGDELYTWGTNGFVVDPSINFIQDAFVAPAAGVLAFPNTFGNLGGVDGWFGPNFSTDAVFAPVPGSLILLGSGLLGLFGIRRRLS
jgi:hypothetical protein